MKASQIKVWRRVWANRITACPKNTLPSFWTGRAWASLVAQLVKSPPAMWETWVWSPGWEDLLEKGKATHSSVLAWRTPWSHKESDTTERLSLHFTSHLVNKLSNNALLLRKNVWWEQSDEGSDKDNIEWLKWHIPTFFFFKASIVLLQEMMWKIFLNGCQPENHNELTHWSQLCLQLCSVFIYRRGC